jgi:RING finger protein 113A
MLHTEKKLPIIKPRKMRGANRKRSVDEGEEEEIVIGSAVNDIVSKKKINQFSTKKEEQKEMDVSHSFESQRELRAGDNFLFSTNEYEPSDRKNQFKNKMTGKGPIRSSASIRTTARFDYQPDICKDYFETGVCGYGDNCKFAHIREDYKTGWQLEKEWNEEQKKKQRAGGYVEDEPPKVEEKDDKLPWACFICRQPFKNPVVTICKHYFCEKCALDNYNGGKQPKCFICNEPTNGIFNTAREIVNKMKRQAEKEAREKSGVQEEPNVEDLQKAVEAEHTKDRTYRAGWAIV